MDEETTAVNPADDQLATPEVQEADESQMEAAEQQPENADEGDELEALLKAATGPEEDNPDLIDVEYEGDNYKLPPKLKDALLRQADYTRKTMEVADIRREVEAAREQVNTINSLTTDQLTAVFAAEQAKARFQQLAATPLDGLTDEEILTLRMDYRDAEQQANNLAQQAAQLIDQGQKLRDQQIAKEREECLKAAAKQVPSFTEQRRTELETLAVTMGANPDEMARITSPMVYKVLHLADIGQRFIESQRKATKVEKAQEAQPVPEVGGKKATAQKDLDRMTPEEYHKTRMKQRMG